MSSYAQSEWRRLVIAPPPTSSARAPEEGTQTPSGKSGRRSSKEDGDDDEGKALLVSAFYTLSLPSEVIFYHTPGQLQAKLTEVRAGRGKRDPHRPRKKVKKEDIPVEKIGWQKNTTPFFFFFYQKPSFGIIISHHQLQS